MSRCVELAKNGFGKTYPNPMVGCLIVHENKIIAEGWHHRAGGPHAEVNAINNLKDEGLIKDSTIYVSLEPCSHFGKTPPCADLIVEKGFKNVVIGMTDPFAKVKGRGIKKLFENGCRVTVGVCEEKCMELNSRFINFHERQRPYVILKWAESQDGFLSPFEYGKTKKQDPVWLTNTYSKQLVHQWRAEEEAIMVGTRTALMDNPSLTTRLWKGPNPLRVLIDRNLTVPKTSAIFSANAKTLVFTENAASTVQKHIDHVEIDFSKNILPQILKELHQRDVQSILIEGGRLTLQAFIDHDLWDEARVFETKVLLHHGTKAPEIKAEVSSSKLILEDKLKIYRRES